MCALSRDSKGGNGWVWPGMAASLASRSAVSWPGSSQCPGIHRELTAMPWGLMFAAARRMIWMICCPDLFQEGDLVEDIDCVQDSDQFSGVYWPSVHRTDLDL